MRLKIGWAKIGQELFSAFGTTAIEKAQNQVS
jgi:hypothetical protein